MKLIHTSDWHLGGRLHEQDRTHEHEQYLEWLINLLREERPDALVVCGDVFDTYTPSNSATQLYYSFLGETFGNKLCGAVVIIGGNHDSPTLLNSPSTALKYLNTHIIGQARENLEDETVVVKGNDGFPGLVIAAVPYMRDADLRNFASTSDTETANPANREAVLRYGFKARYAAAADIARKAAPDVPIVLLGHCTISSARVSDEKSERSRTIGGIDSFSGNSLPAADYIALGHLHIPQAVGGSETIRYSGSPIPMSFAEANDEKSVVIAEFDRGRNAPVNIRTSTIPSFQKLVSISGTPEEATSGIKELVAGNSDVWASVEVNEGEGDIRGFWNEIDEAARDSRVKILVKHDTRPRNFTGGIAGTEADDLKTLKPEDVARRRLAEENLSEAEIEEYMGMVRLAIKTMDEKDEETE